MSERSAAARDLARTGTFDDLATLVAMAIDDKSSAVRLYTAAAAADILHRLRGLHGAALDAAQRTQVATWARSFDPGRNPGLLMLLSALPDPDALDRLGRMLRDPRNGVRVGAAMALRRMALSSAAVARTDIEPAVGEWLADTRLPADARLELVRLVGDIGYTTLVDAVSRSASAGHLHEAAVDEALARLELRGRIEAWDGFYRADGLDVFEVTVQPGAPAFTIVADGRAAEVDGVRTLALTPQGPRLGDAPVRLVWAPQMGEDPEVRVAAMQTPSNTLWRCEGRALVSAIEEFLPTFRPEHAFALDALDARLQTAEGVSAQRVRGMLAWRAGRFDEAATLLEGLIDAKKPRADLYFWLGRVYAERGESARAREALETFLDRAGKRATWRDEADALLAGL